MKQLTIEEMTRTEGGSVQDFLWGFCLVGGLLSGPVAIGCVGYAVGEKIGWW